MLTTRHVKLPLLGEITLVVAKELPMKKPLFEQEDRGSFIVDMGYASVHYMTRSAVLKERVNGHVPINEAVEEWIDAVTGDEPPAAVRQGNHWHSHPAVTAGGEVW